MLVRTFDREYTLYIGANGVWTMHVWNPLAPDGQRWLDTFARASETDPFKSVVEYDAWA